MYISYDKNIDRNQSVLRSYLWVSFAKNQSAVSYFPKFLLAGFNYTSNEETEAFYLFLETFV